LSSASNNPSRSHVHAPQTCMERYAAAPRGLVTRRAIRTVYSYCELTGLRQIGDTTAAMTRGPCALRPVPSTTATTVAPTCRDMRSDARKISIATVLWVQTRFDVPGSIAL
jgi:hypothetical protein